MSIFVCGQDDIIGNVCVECEAPLNRRGITVRVGRVCSEDCAADQADRIAAQDRRTHLNQRDLSCDCDICTAAGHPTEAEQREWSDYLAGKS